MPVIAVASQKGGSGKSTLTIAIACALLQLLEGWRIRIIDADPQGTSAEWHRARLRPQLEALELVEHTTADLHQRGPLAQPGEVVVIDCPGRLDAVLRSAACAADFLLVPMAPTYPEGWALPKLAAQLALAQEHRTTPLPVGVVLNRIRTGTRLAKGADKLGAQLPPGFTLLASRIRDLTDFQICFGEYCSPLELQPRGNAAADQRALAMELLTLLRIT